MIVTYRGKKYEVASTSYLGNTGLFGLKSKFANGAVFPASKALCK